MATSGSLEARKRAHWDHLHLLDVPTSRLANPQVFGPPQLNLVPKWSRLWAGLVTYLEDNRLLQDTNLTWMKLQNSLGDSVPQWMLLRARATAWVHGQKCWAGSTKEMIKFDLLFMWWLQLAMTVLMGHQFRSENKFSGIRNCKTSGPLQR